MAFAICNMTLGLASAFGQAWPQWAHDPQHTGSTNVAGQRLNNILADIVYDPLVPQEQALNGGDLLAHYQVPLVDGNDVYMESKTGNYNKGTYSSQAWHQNKFSWVNGVLTKIWTFDSDWDPPGSQGDFWEPVYHAVLANGFLYDPGQGGTIFKINKADGSVVTRLNPFGTMIDSNTFTVSPLSADSAGNVYFNVLRLQSNSGFYSHDAVDSWLVKVSPNDTIQKVSYSVLVPDAPAATDLCYSAFSGSQLPWPPAPDAVPPQSTCGLQRVALNIAPAIAPDGTIYSITRAQFFTRYGFLVAVNPNLTPKWDTSLRGPDAPGPFPQSYLNGGYFHDGCNDGTAASSDSQLPANGQPGGCRVGARAGIGPDTNRYGGGRVLDDSSSTPIIAPDGSVFYGAWQGYDYLQGELMHFSSTGQFIGYFGFGWDDTPAIYQHDGTYSVITKNNHYSDTGSYCGVDAFCPPDRTATNAAYPEEYFITQLTPNAGYMHIEWTFKSTNTQSCTRLSNGSISCVSDHPRGFEWCVNAPAVDSRGIVYANSEDGNLYSINQGGTQRQNIFQQLALGAAYTPASIGGDGRIYTQNAGHMFVVGR
ncbi:MAG: hypothetical protein AUG51_15205 [Acidobacteria bacterium 13_1_20CM_3_53_8]|nr:MAG: hypothetical protein AUG51_15205 [Acidobacteria bacterium 13_1_20CM_3_53_8]